MTSVFRKTRKRKAEDEVRGSEQSEQRERREGERSETERPSNVETVAQQLSPSLLSPQINLGRMLAKVCKNPGNCLALGVYGEYIKRYFNNFRDLALINLSAIKRLGAPSENGFVLELPFIKHQYTAYTALKCAIEPTSDNLLYEYYVGKYFINKQLTKWPCFVETYDCYTMKTHKDWNDMYAFASGKRPGPPILADRLIRATVNENDDDVWNNACYFNRRICVLIQHFDRFMTFDSACNDGQIYDEIKYDIPCIFYQTYFPLACLGDKYTHYDLHTGNVGLYKPFDGKKYVLMRYHNTKTNVTTEFESEFIVKLIDYGRNYFNNGTTTTDQILGKMCAARECQPDCGENHGFANILGNYINPSLSFYWIFPNRPNRSHDLRFYAMNRSWGKILGQATYLDNYGTPEDMTGNAQNIKSTLDLRDRLETIIPIWKTRRAGKKYDATWQQTATMDVYDDGRDYVFELLPEP